MRRWKSGGAGAMIARGLSLLTAAAIGLSPISGVAIAQNRYPITSNWAANTRWSGFANCSTVQISLASGGGVSVSNGTTGTWRVEGGLLHVTLGRNWSATMARPGQFDLDDTGSDGPGSRWTRCDDLQDLPLLPADWIAGSSWGQIHNGDCWVRVTLERNHNVRIFGGFTGFWSVRDSLLIVRGARGVAYTFTRLGDQIVDGGGAYGRLSRCRT